MLLGIARSLVAIGVYVGARPCFFTTSEISLEYLLTRPSRKSFRDLVAIVLLTAATLGQWLLTNASDTPVQQAYIGPGAGIALLGSFFAVFLAMVSAMAVILTWPIRRISRTIRGRRAIGKAKVKRVVILGLDGLEPTLTDKFMSDGLLPNLVQLAEQGSFRKLGTTCPPLSPVAWSSFSTGTNPGKHNIFDFISRHPESYQPRISSVRIGEPRRKLEIGKYVIPLSRPELTGLRKSKPFWSILGEAGIFSAVLRVPITFPPDRFNGVQLSAMCVPDLLGTQGMFSYYCEQGETGATTDGDVGGQRIVVERKGHTVQSYLKGPPNPIRKDQGELRLPFWVEPANTGAAAMLHINDQKIPLMRQAFSDWVRIAFSMAPGMKLRGICRFFLKRFDDGFEMYCTPLQIDPDKPVMPIGNPTVYSSYLARQQGSYSTLGLAEDTWSLSEQLMSEDAFLTQAYDIHEERQTMFFDALRRVRRGMVACVFDAPDRIQHMFWRFMDDDHPAVRGQDNTHPNAIRDMYMRMDELVGQTMAKLDKDSALFVMSDHGFKPFRRCVDLNSWLLQNDYLKLKNGKTESSATYLADVDWSQTKAYAIGLAGIFVNQEGREGQGIVPDGQARKELVDQIVSQLTGLKDSEAGEVAIHEAISREKAYSGPYVESAPDIIIGYNVGYRVSWDSAVGKTSASVFYDNTKPWSGDHCIHPDLVPGVLFSNLKIEAETANIIDIAPTALNLLGIERPAYMDGRSLV